VEEAPSPGWCLYQPSPGRPLRLEKTLASSIPLDHLAEPWRSHSDTIAGHWYIRLAISRSSVSELIRSPLKLSEEICQRSPEGLRYAVRSLYGDVPLTPLDRANISLVQSHPEGERFLSIPSLLP
jgi:hypothetical protein